jgi:uncharacterized protein YdeI (YjbR/CyaY-like superfamily)
MNPKVDAYIERAEQWPDELSAVRPILLDAGLTEEIKWGKPCYSHDGKNILILQEMKAFLSVMFFKGALLRDPDGVLVDQGPNSRSARRIELTSTDDVARLAGTLTAYIEEAIDVEDAGLEVGPAPATPLATELQQRLDGDPELRAAFQALTPGRQREYNLHISEAKQASTRASRVEKQIDRIKAGKGLRDR